MTDNVKFPLAGKRVWVAGHRGMVGSALLRRLERENCTILTAKRRELDLTDQTSTRKWLNDHRPDAVFVAAAKVGGIVANSSFPAEFLYENLMIGANIIEAAYRTGTAKLVYLGSSCIYPKASAQPIEESALLAGPLESTNEWYAIAKISGLKLCEAFRRQFGADFVSAMPSNLYGPGDNFNPETSHVIPGLMHKAHEAKTRKLRKLIVWGSGTPRREFLHVDDCADALVRVMTHYSENEHINVGSGEDIAIADLAALVAKIVGFKGELVYDSRKPDGTPRKLMSPKKMRALGWTARVSLSDGLSEVYAWYLRHRASQSA